MKHILRKIAGAFSLQYDKASNEEIHETLISGANVKGTNLVVLILAILIASIGLNMNSTAVIIGAMLISPLMGGIMAIGYGMATNDFKLIRKAALGLLFQIIICIMASTLYFSITPISAARSELLARTTPTIWDVMIAILGGLAGIIGVTRKERTNVIPGVAIATALMPPLCTAGYGIAMGIPTFIFGATYLFLINSLFICITTFIIIRMMRIPKKQFVDEETQKRTQRYMTAAAIVTIAPSIILGYQIVGDSVRENSIKRYIDTEFNLEGTQVVSTDIDDANAELNIALLGKRLDQSAIELLDQQLKNYGLEDLTLNVTQTQMSETLGYEDVELIIEQELNDISKEIALGDKDREIEYLKEELIRYKTDAIEYQNMNYDIVALTEEIKVIFAQIESFTIGNHKIVDTITGEEQFLIIATIEANAPITEQERKIIIDWIKVKTNAEDIKLYIDVIPQIEQVVEIVEEEQENIIHQ